MDFVTERREKRCSGISKDLPLFVFTVYGLGSGIKRPFPARLPATGVFRLKSFIALVASNKTQIQVQSYTVYKRKDLREGCV